MNTDFRNKILNRYVESAENENGGPLETIDRVELDRRWLEEFGGLLGLRTNDLEDILKIPKNKLIQYTYPSAKELKRVGTIGLFLGQFLPWDGHKNAEIAASHGFRYYKNK